MDVQTILAEPPWWMWAVYVVMSVLGGAAAGITVFEGVKQWRKEHQKPLMDSECRLWGRVASAVATASVWIVTATLTSGYYFVSVPLAVFSALFAPWLWGHARDILKAIKPEWADRMSGQ